MAAETAPAEPPPQKFSRYRSVRRAQAQHAQGQQNPLDTQQPTAVPPMPPLPPMEPTQEAPVSRSMSRYHRRPTTSHGAAKPPPPRSATVQVPLQPQPAQTATSSRNRAVSSPQARPLENAPPRVPNTSRARAEPAPTAAASPRPSRTARDEAKQLIQEEAERQRRLKEKLEAEKRAKVKAEQEDRERQERQRREEEEETERLRVLKEAEEAELLRRQREEKDRGKRLQKAEAVKRLQEREEAERKMKVEEAMRKLEASSPPTSPPRHGGALGLFRRRKDSSAASPESSPNGKAPQTSYANRDMDNIMVGGGGAVLGIDAPISAVNAGDRRVTILCNKKRFMLPITPETTTQDLLKSAATCMTDPINLSVDILVENFLKVSVKRPLRLYERVRDVMNSWDNDTQNDLEIVNAAYNDYDRQALLASQVPDTKPEGMGCYIHHSSRPGKWSKRYVALRSDGQLVMAKSETSKDQETICHLSDFDIYIPTERKRSKVKPPKKNCYAVKSQQKSNIFSDESRYVHFFCTNDRGTAMTFYDAVQGWRSWHLKHVMGEGQKKPKAQESKPANGYSVNNKVLTALEHGSASHTRNASNSSYYQLGTFQPLFDMDKFGQDLDAEMQRFDGQDATATPKMNTKAMHARKMSTRVKGPPPTAFSRSGLVNEATSAPVDNSNPQAQSSSRPDGDTFAAGGLLGRTYSQRQRVLQDREKKASGPFTEGPSLVGNIDSMAQAAANDGGLNRRSSVRSTHRRTSSDIQRSASTRMKPKPLVDLTPQYREPPQHRNKGKGFGGAGAGPLIDNATSIEEAIKVPSSTDWRARPTHGTYGTGRHERTRSLKGRGEGLAAYTVNNHSGAPDETDGFTGGGLLAQAGYSQGHQPVGHGVMDGSKARGPMLDMRENARFASGSLLADVARRQGGTGPAVERDKRQSVDMG